MINIISMFAIGKQIKIIKLKKKLITGKLSLEKLTIAKLVEARSIKGGSAISDHSNCERYSDYCGGGDQTLTVVGPTQIGTNRPTKQNCFGL